MPDLSWSEATCETMGSMMEKYHNNQHFGQWAMRVARHPWMQNTTALQLLDPMKPVSLKNLVECKETVNDLTKILFQRWILCHDKTSVNSHHPPAPPADTAHDCLLLFTPDSTLQHCEMWSFIGLISNNPRFIEAMEDPAWLLIPNSAPARACNQPAADAEPPTMVDRRTLVRALTDYQYKLLDRANHYWFDDNKLKKGSVSLKNTLHRCPRAVHPK